MNWRQAHHEGKVWLKLSLSGGKATPLLGACKIESKGPAEPDTAFLIYMLVCGHSVEDAQRMLEKAKRRP